ncbi:hypothetical protein BJD99_01690 [Rhodococcus sp. 1163]|nr:hypothetical protein BJD99_01690 [Rhodococcus sp. 1163]
MNEAVLRELTPAVIGVLVHRGVDFATAEDAVQEALIRAASTWPDRPPDDPKGWLVKVAWRKFLDAHRSETARRDRELRVDAQPMPGPVESVDDRGGRRRGSRPRGSGGRRLDNAAVRGRVGVPARKSG